MRGMYSEQPKLKEKDSRGRRVLFVLSSAKGGPAEEVFDLLKRNLSKRDYLLDAIVCYGYLEEGIESDSHRQMEEVDFDCVPYNLTFGERLRYLSNKLLGYDIVVSCQNVAEMSPALEKLHWRPPLIELSGRTCFTVAGPKQVANPYADLPTLFTTSGMEGIETECCLQIPSSPDHKIVAVWQSTFEKVLSDRSPASPPCIFASFMQGGFECSTHKRSDGRRLDLIAATGHDKNVVSDYQQLRRYGMLTVRDGLRWHLIEPHPGQFDWTSFLPMLQAAKDTDTQVVWDLLHYGWPDDIDIWSPHFVERFARFAASVAELVKLYSDVIPFFCPINEISFFAWAGGDVAYMNPFGQERSFELKAQLARASIAAMQEILCIDPRARFVHCEPIINIVASSSDGRYEAERARQAQFQAFDMISGSLWPQLGGDPRLLDIVGVNYYKQNQWVQDGFSIDESDHRYRPFHILLGEVYARYGRPVLVAETGTEGDARESWLEMVREEVRVARRAGVPVEGLCLYPIIDHPGWDDDRYCPSGLMTNSFEDGERSVYKPLKNMLARISERNFT